MAKRNKGVNIFRHVPKANLPRTAFNMSHDVKFSGDFGKAYPIFMEEVIPGDTWRLEANHFSRLAPMVAPVLHEYDVRFHWFFVPMRLLWDDFEDWMTGGRTGTWREEHPDAFPTISIFECAEALGGNVGSAAKDIFRGTIFDFMGLNLGEDGTVFNTTLEDTNAHTWRLNMMPLRGYIEIFNYFFRDQNVMDEFSIDKSSGNEDVDVWRDVFNNTIFYDYNSDVRGSDGMFKVAFDKDYFTSATLTPQRGPQVFIPIGSEAPLVNVNPLQTGGDIGQEGTRISIGNGISSPVNDLPISSINEGGATVLGNGGSSGLNVVDLSRGMVADLSSAQGAAVNDVREGFALQRFFERMNIIGSRFAEFLRGIWGTNAGDARLQMPEYLGTWTNPFMINNVSQTSATTGDSPQGGYSGNGLSAQYNAPIVKNFPEYGYLYCLYIAMPRNGYQQGCRKHLLKKDWLDFANPYFEHIGEQPIMQSELYLDLDITEANDPIFGYQSQYASYKFINSHSHGDFKQSLNFWHSNRIFSGAPTLSEDFIHFDPEETTNRAFQLTEEPKFYSVVNFKVSAERNLSAFSTPRLL